ARTLPADGVEGVRSRRGSRDAPQHVRELLDTAAARESLAPLVRERRAIQASRLPAPVEVEQRLADRGLVVRWDDDARARVAHELRGGAVGRDHGEDGPLGGEVLEDLPGKNAAAAAAGLRDQEEQRLGVPLQLE